MYTEYVRVAWDKERLHIQYSGTWSYGSNLMILWNESLPTFGRNSYITTSSTRLYQYLWPSTFVTINYQQTLLPIIIFHSPALFVVFEWLDAPTDVVAKLAFALLAFNALLPALPATLPLSSVDVALEQFKFCCCCCAISAAFTSFLLGKLRRCCWLSIVIGEMSVWLLLLPFELSGETLSPA